MATLVEQAVYHPPEPGEHGIFLNSSYNFRRDVTKGGFDNPRRYEDLSTLAQEIGLRRDRDVPTRYGNWHIYEGLDLAIPNFPKGDTRVNEALALYERDGDLTNAILRLQRGGVRKTFTVEELKGDLKAFTKYYIERPRFVGFPSEFLTQSKPHLWIYMTFLPGAAIGFFAFNEGRREYADIIGTVAGPLVSGMTTSLWWLSERRARGKIPHTDEYMGGNNAAKILISQNEHIIRASIQRELYEVLQQSGSTLSPNKFLGDIYAQMPSKLVRRRIQEMERAKYPEKYTRQLTPEAFPKMVEVAQILQSAA